MSWVTANVTARLQAARRLRNIHGKNGERSESMVKKYIIEIEEEPLVRKSAFHGETAVWRASGFNSLVFDNNGLDKLTPYTEPDIEQIRNDAYSKGHNDGLKVGYENLKAVECERIDKAYKRGYDDAKHECQDCQKIMTDAEQERVDKAYQQGLEDARNRKATCEFCEYVGNDDSNEPCVRCCCGYINMFRPRKDNNPIYKSIKDIMDSLDCTISDFEKAIEEIKNEAD